MKAKKVQGYPVELITGTQIELYIIPISILKRVKELRIESTEDLAKLGVF